MCNYCLMVLTDDMNLDMAFSQPLLESRRAILTQVLPSRNKTNSFENHSNKLPYQFQSLIIIYCFMLLYIPLILIMIKLFPKVWRKLSYENKNSLNHTSFRSIIFLEMNELDVFGKNKHKQKQECERIVKTRNIVQHLNIS